MANILKAGSTYAPTNNQGLDLTGSDYVGVIDDIRYDKKSKRAFFSVEIYANSETAATRKEEMSNISPVDRINFNFNNEEFDEKVGNDGLSIPQAYTLSLETLTDWCSDEA